ncbi:hypothetical protein [uncultured Maribacter sp.]|uniref:hypothetical protein n=1 Tax=uncultured Maribacter sp. TaxID=431308 RepID=UPI0030D82401|tara:strand:- start:228 stop:548 length:321 start_codon:yes stop_codon:yes gene_type:complete
MEEKFKNWLKLRKESKDEFGDVLCYCGHTDKCDCGDPTIDLFNDSIERGVLDVNDAKNGWKTVDFYQGQEIQNSLKVLKRRTNFEQICTSFLAFVSSLCLKPSKPL